MAVKSWLIDKSALARLPASPDAAKWSARIERGLIRITTVTLLEVGYSARSGPEFRSGLRQPPLSAPMGPGALGATRRAIVVPEGEQAAVADHQAYPALAFSMTPFTTSTVSRVGRKSKVNSKNRASLRPMRTCRPAS